MKLIAFYSFIVLGLSSCVSETEYANQPDPNAIVKDFTTWWNYNTEKINFAREYTTFDKDFKPISKESFFYNLMSGDYIALKLLSKDTLVQHYKLYPLGPTIKEDIKQQSADFGERQYQKFKMEGMPLPDFNFTDLNGTVYNKETTRNKIIVLNVWFMRCVPCVAEIPALNEIVNEYKNRQDIMFLGLTWDAADAVIGFLKKKEFNYSIIPDQENYVKEKLGIRAYPYQIIVNREGKIVKVFDDYEDIIYWLKKDAKPLNTL